MDISLSPAALALVPVVMALTSASKTYVDSKWSPLVALALSLIAAFVIVPTDTVAGTVIEGVVMGLTASGLYSGGKTLGAARPK